MHRHSFVQPLGKCFSSRTFRLLSMVLILWGVSVPTASAGEAAANVKVIIETINGLSAWLEEYDDNCAVACAGAAGGTDCSFIKEECTDTGGWSATCIADAENGCGHGLGEALAEESIFGMWWGFTTEPRVVAFAKPLHGGDDHHSASGWAQAQVDGTSRAKIVTTQPSRPSRNLADRGGRELDLTRGRSGFTAASTWPEGTVLAVAFFDSVRLSVSAGMAVANCSMHAKLDIDDTISWEMYVSLDQSGILTATGGITGGDYLVTYDPEGDTWDATLAGLRMEIPIDTLNTAFSSDSIDVGVSFDIELIANEAEADGPPPPPIPVTPADLRENTPDGVPVLDGTYVQVITPMVAIAESAPFGPFLDTNVADGEIGVGVLDVAGAQDWQSGDLRTLTGYVTHHAGRTLLTGIQSTLISTGVPVPPTSELPISVILSNAEQLEGRRVRVNDCTLIDSNEWPDDPRQIAIVRVEDPSGFEIDLEVLAPPEIVQGFAPSGSFHATGVLLQKDPDGVPLDSGYRIRLELIEETGTSEVEEAPLQSLTNLSAWPSPSSTVTDIMFSLHDAGAVRVHVLDANGRRVRTLVERDLGEGMQRTSWDLRNDHGEPVATGVYFLRLATGGEQTTRKLTVLR